MLGCGRQVNLLPHVSVVIIDHLWCHLVVSLLRGQLSWTGMGVTAHSCAFVPGVTRNRLVAEQLLWCTGKLEDALQAQKVLGRFPSLRYYFFPFRKKRGREGSKQLPITS